MKELKKLLDDSIPEQVAKHIAICYAAEKDEIVILAKAYLVMKNYLPKLLAVAEAAAEYINNLEGETVFDDLEASVEALKELEE